MNGDLWLILITILGIGLLLYLVMVSKMQAFVALLISSILIGLASGMNLNKIVETVEEGMGGTLGFIAE